MIEIDHNRCKQRCLVTLGKLAILIIIYDEGYDKGRHSVLM